MAIALRRCGRLLMLAAVLAVSAPAAAGGAHTLSVGATVLSKSNCKFNSKTSTLNIGAIDPSSAANVVVSTTTLFSCKGSQAVAVYSITTDDGLYETGAGAPRMRHATVTTEFLPYTLNFPQSGSVPKNVDQTVTITGTVPVTSFQNALPGSYSDTVVLTLQP